MVTATSAQNPTTAFTQPFDWTTNTISVLPSTNWGLFKADDTVTISTSDNSPITIFDLYGNTVYSGPPGFRTFEPGHYFVECNGDRNQFAVLPADYAGASFLGDIAYNGYGWWSQRQSQIQIGWLRTSAGQWRKVQPERGVWDWALMDSTLAYNAGHKMMVMAGNWQPPGWVQPNDLITNYVAYVTALVERYPGRIAAIEIWNEPDFAHFWSDPQWLHMLADLYVAGRAAIKAVNPGILVLGPTWSSPRHAGTAGLAEYGFAAQIDAFSWHDYLAYKFPPDQDVLQGDKTYPDILERAALQRAAARFSGPLFINEIGLYGQSALGIPTPHIHPGLTGTIANAPEWSVGMTRGVKYAVLYRSAGAEEITPHLLIAEPTGLDDLHYSLCGWDYGPRGPAPKTSAFLMTCYWLNGSELVDYRILGEQIVLTAWRRANNTSVVFAWAVEEQSFDLSSGTPINFGIRDVYGSPVQPSVLNENPILFYSNSPDAAALLQSVMADLPALNLPPTLAFLSNDSIFKDQPLRFIVQADDPDNDPITYSASPLPPGATLDPTTGVFSWTPTAQQIGTYSITFTAMDARGLSDSTTTMISVLGSSTDGLVGWWKFDETSGATAADSVGSNPGSLQGFAPLVSWGAGKITNSLEFDGVDDYVNLDSSKLSLFNNFTVASWIHPRGDKHGAFFCLRYRNSSSGFRFAVRTNNDLIIVGQTTTGFHIDTFAVGQIQDNEWNHVVVVYDKSIFTVYLNGVRVDPGGGATGNWGGDFVMNADDVTRIGAEGVSAGPKFFFDGWIDDTRVYNRTLSAREVLALYRWPLVAPRPPVNLERSGP